MWICKQVNQKCSSIGSYCLDIEGGADIYVNGMNALTGWGAIGANDVNGVHYENSVINRVDVHSSGHNIFVDNCDLHTSGVIYGWGGGVLSIKNSRLYRCAAISHRTDYGGSFFGAMVVDGCEFTYNTSLGLAIVDLFGSPLGASTPVYAPKSISVTSCKRTGASSSLVNPGEVIPVRIKIKDAGSVVYAPTSISVHNISSQPLWRFSIYIDWLNMEANPQNWETILQFSGVFPTHAATTSTGVVEYASIRSPLQSVTPWIVGADSNHIHIVCTSAATAQIILSNVGINGVAVNNVTPPRCLIDGCKFTNPASGYNSSTNLAPVGGPQVGNNAFTTVRNCEIGSNNVWNFGNVRGAIGNTIRGGSLTPVLPAGVTPTQFFTGWRASGAFQS